MAFNAKLTSPLTLTSLIILCDHFLTLRGGPGTSIGVADQVEKILGTGTGGADQNGNLRNPDRRKANVMEHLLDQLNGAIDGIASCLADPIHDEWFQTGKATQTLKEAARRLNDIAHGIQIERDQYLEFMSE